jgi:comEA protein
MKKPRIHPMILISLVFVTFLFGIFAGRNLNRTPVQIQVLPKPTISTATEPDVPSAWPVNINTADSQTLQQLPGIGPVIAQRIMDYRDAHGAFDTIGELINVDGIGEKTLEKLWDYVITGG